MNPSDNQNMGLIKGFGKYVIRSIFISFVVTLSISVFADEFSQVNSEALDNTVKLLNSPAQRQDVIDKSDEAKRADNMARKLLGKDADVQQLYKMDCH